ncbi:hypothetical protein ColTof4_08175 [Colletotrichum tofieldiae]|uniref:Uncharacterized protein n=1 Tax=Colletotrichum tofieldiae TaxID=708197 RepID=A0A166S2M9_9PEZI|nr:hypothetical protein CT0861_12618 [Colletotrichum tofieldiae]GKT54966.1 hypothetical protein ColTof3_02305 [Colletotrichum tofieldiae]GKT75752.1 hypothetical protein ColTof4_08175 [Colletotrichum tofieldiae]GKT83447.1 hypothetical protein Ct61P_01297 [Colletotrichum tofieldiae]
MLSGRLLTVLGLVGIVTASPQIQIPPSDAADCPRTMCLDGINPECSIRWGGCYDMCKPYLRPTMPPCKSTLSRSTASKTPQPVPPLSLKPSVPIPTGGLVNNKLVPTGSPLSLKPLLPTKQPSGSNKQSTSSENCSSRTICVDYIDDCGQMYGGPWPSYSKPPCTPTVTLDPSTPPTQY